MLRIVVLVMVLVLASCVPQSEEAERVEVTQLTEAISYYPQQVGAQWSFLQENVPLDSAPLVLKIAGPTIINGDLWVRSDMVGQGFEVSRFMQYRDNGVYLLREERPGTQITFDPPIQRYPAANTLRVGSSWGGLTQARLFFPEAQEGTQESFLEVDYTFSVVDERTITSPAGSFEVFVINFVTRTVDEESLATDELTQEIWFSPNIGEVRTEQGYFLVSTNLVSEAE